MADEDEELDDDAALDDEEGDEGEELEEPGEEEGIGEEGSGEAGRGKQRGGKPPRKGDRSRPGDESFVSDKEGRAAGRKKETPIQKAARIKRSAQKAAKKAQKLAKETPRKLRQLRAAIDAIQKTTRAAFDAAARLAKGLGDLLPKLIPLLANPVTWVIILAIVIVAVFATIFMSSANYINSLAGGSEFLAANYDDPLQRQIVENLQQKLEGCDPKLVVYPAGADDLAWQTDPDTGRKYHRLDIRALKTLDYLTDRHERVRVDLLNTGAPDMLRDSFLKRIAHYSPTGEEQQETKETLSAFKTGQAIAIVEIDRSEIPQLQQADTACGAPVPAPIAVNWQKTVGEKTIRPIWEELSFTAGYLDKNLDSWYVAVAERGDREAILKVAQAYKAGLGVSGSYNAYKESFKKIPRIAELIDRAIMYGTKQADGKQALDDRTLKYLQEAKVDFDEPARRIGDSPESLSVEAIADLITYLGQPDTANQLRQGIRFVYKATQVANMVNWDKSKKSGDLAWLKAYESRNKIRQAIKELMEMPREASLTGQAVVLFNEELMAKQIITWSPEDDLDNGLEGLDVFPYGVVAVDVGGVGMKTLSIDSETGNATGDGEVTTADVHFSHAPIDNGVFSKSGTNYVYEQVDPADPWWKKAGAFIFQTSAPGAAISSAGKLHDLLVGGCVASSNETCKPVSYRDFLYVAF